MMVIRMLKNKGLVIEEEEFEEELLNMATRIEILA